MELSIVIETNDKMVGFDLFESKSLNKGKTEKKVNDGVSIKYQGTVFSKFTRRMRGIQIVAYFDEKNILFRILPQIFTMYIFNKLLGKAKKIIINDQPVEIRPFQAEKIAQVIYMKINQMRPSLL